MSDVPSITQFDPRVIPYQWEVTRGVRAEYDYSLGFHEIFLSGAVGSAKSLLGAHLIVTHCMENEQARALLGRRSMPDLKETIFQTVCEHLEDENLVEGEDFEITYSKAKIQFYNGSEIISRSWADRKFKKFRSLKLSAAAIEELTENDETDKQAITELKARIGRLPYIREKFIVYMTNPDSPRHWAYKEFIERKMATLHVYYSMTRDNPFLPPNYEEQLLREYDPKTAERMVKGRWIEIDGEGVYHAYSEKNFVPREYGVDLKTPIRVAFDFNIGEGKPLSACASQYIHDTFHFFKEFIVHGARTADVLDEIAGSGLLEYPVKFIIHGDATGKARDTRSRVSDYDIIEKFFANYVTKSGRHLDYELAVPMSNPPVRARHNKVNGYCKNAAGETRFFVYASCKVLDEGMRLTQLKKGGQYAEDDSKAYQHVTTAAGYAVCTATEMATKVRSRTIQL